MKVTSKLIKQLDGKPIRLTSEYANGNLLSVDSNGLISLQEPNPPEEYDQHWKLDSVEKGFLISSVVDNYLICYDPSAQQIKTTVKEKGKDCIWKVGVGGEFYQPISSGGERYLWVAGGKLHATSDGYLAENWTPLDIGNNLPGVYTEKHGGSPSSFMVVILVIIVFLLIYLIWNRSENNQF